MNVGWRHSSQAKHVISVFVVMIFLFGDVYSQEKNQHVPLARSHREGNVRLQGDSLLIDTTRLSLESVDSLVDIVQKEDGYVRNVTQTSDTASVLFSVHSDSLLKSVNQKMGVRFIPDPKKAMWLAIIFPGGGQIYNRKYWKLPLIYGGLLGCIYAMNWNNTMYRDYSQAYIDIMDSDENTKSYENFIPAKYNVSANKTRLQELFRRKKNYYRRFRDLSMFCMIGVYALSIIDAYVDAEMSSFDISRDLSLKIHPTIINSKYSVMQAQGIRSNSYGLQCSLNF